ncbi:MAG: hypothetical protein AAGM22_25430 [Acidobacteriota bacterium]
MDDKAPNGLDGESQTDLNEEVHGDRSDAPAPGTFDSDAYETLLESQRRTWEMELLISGAVVFALFQVPSALESGFQRLLVPLSRAQEFATSFAFIYTKMIVLVLIAAFLLHLGTRAFWVGLIGLRSVYPHGIDWDEVHDGPIWKEILQAMPSLGDLADITDRLASRIFSFAFMWVIFFVISIFYVAVFLGLSWALIATVLPGLELQTVAFILILIFVVPSTLIGLADKSYKRRGVEPPASVKSFLKPLMLFYHHTGLGSLIKPILYTFTSNLRRTRAFGLLGAAFLVLYVGLFGQMILDSADRAILHGYAYVPPRDGELSVRDRYYENLRVAGPKHSRFPSLSSDVAEGPYLKLFLPYVPKEDNRTLEARCPELTPWPWTLKRPRQNPERADEEKAIACLRELYDVELNGEAFSPEFHLYKNPNTQIRGLLTYLRTEDLAPGRHAIRIVENDIDNEVPVIHNIPFWR